MRKYVLILIVVNSCCGIQDEIYYSYNNTIITRIDECDRSTFYYGRGVTNAKIWVEYSGINDGFSGYLGFEKGGRVTLYSGNGDFRVQNRNNSPFVFQRVLSFEAPTIGDSVCAIDLSTRYEAAKNSQARSAVSVEYQALQ